MCLDAEQKKAALLAANDHGESVTFKMQHDPRITPVGRIIRKLSIDEMPQLWLVLKGDMSLVGPRPPVPREVAEYTLADRRRLDAKPGLTCIWQVSGRGDIPFDQQVGLDVDYIDPAGAFFEIGTIAVGANAVVVLSFDHNIPRLRVRVTPGAALGKITVEVVSSGHHAAGA